MQAARVKRNRLYDEFAHLWPVISDPADYAYEASHWRNTIREKLGDGRHRLLELGVGGGNMLSHLVSEFDAVGVDISDKMLANSRRLNPSVEHVIGDMRHIRLDQLFDAVIIHDAINYMVTEQDIRDIFETAHAHLRPGGIVIAAPDYYRETFTDPIILHSHSVTEKVRLTHIEYFYDLDVNDSVIECLMIYVIREGGKLRIHKDMHVLGLFAKQRWLELLLECGFAVETRPYLVHDDHREAWLLVGARK